MSRSRSSVLLLLAACGPAAGGDDDASTDANPSSTSSTGPSSSTASSSSPPSPTGGDTTGGDSDPSTTSGSSSSGADDLAFIMVPDGGTCGIAPEGTLHHCSRCDVWSQDCAEGDKCNPWSNDGSDMWNATTCVPIDPDAVSVGDPCTIDGTPASGRDNCGISAMCWNVDPGTLEGECVQFCEGSENDPICPPTSDCMIANDGVLVLCLPTCDPLATDACDDGHSCHPIGDTWFCLPDGAPVRDGPLTPTLCAPGTTAVDPMLLASTCEPEAELCCAEICDVASPTCPEPLQCSAVGSSNAGVCVDP